MLKFVTLPAGCGYGDAGVAYVRGLADLGVPVCWIPMLEGDGPWSPSFGFSPGEGRYFGPPAAQETSDTLLLQLPPFAQASFYLRWLEEDSVSRPVVYTTWECDRLPDWWVDAMDWFELVLVPSTFNREHFRASGVTTPIEVIPHVARVVEPAAPVPLGEIDDEDFVFYTIGSWTTRKAMEQTVRAYLETFQADDPVALVIKTDPLDQLALRRFVDTRATRSLGSFATTWWTVAHLLTQIPAPPKVHLIGRAVPQSTIDAIHTRGDCFVSLTYGEGWGLGPFEAGLFGNPSIITGWGGQLDFLGREYPLLVDYELEPTTAATPDLYIDAAEDRFWARADPGHAGELMRWAFEHREEVRALGSSLQADLPVRFASERVCGHLAEVLGVAPQRGGE